MEENNKVGIPTNDEMSNIVQKILTIQKEEELTNLIDNDPFFSEYCDWEPVAGDNTNIRFIGNQKTTAVGTLTELLVNSIDSLLILGCIKSGKNPNEKGVPKNMKDASELYYGIPNGNIGKCFPKGRLESTGTWTRLSDNIKNIKDVPITELAGNINMIFLGSGSKNHNTIIVYDRGMGQSPQKFKDSFLYYQTNNKLNIPFVQGKYAMGATGVFSRCGLMKYVFILSTKHPDVCGPAEKNKWGFTIIRKNNNILTKLDFYEYLCIRGEEKRIFSFFSKLILNAISGDMYDNNKQTTLTCGIELGTYIKLFDFDIGVWGVKYMMDMFGLQLYDPVLPIRIDDGTVKKGKRQSWYLIGAETRFLMRRLIHPDYMEGIKIQFETKYGIKFDCRVLIFKNYAKDRSDKIRDFKLGNQFRQNPNICALLTYNGQTHATLNKRFLGSNFKYHYIKDKIFIIVDFKDVMENHPQYRMEYFKADREQLYKNEFTGEFKNTLRYTIESNPTLKKLNELYHQERIEKSKVDENFGDYLEKYLKKNPNLKVIFTEKARDFLKLKGKLKKQGKKLTTNINIRTEEPIVIEEEIVEMSENPQVLEWISKGSDNLMIKKVNTNYKTFLLQLITDVMDLDAIIIKSYKEPRRVKNEDGSITTTAKKKKWKKKPAKSLSKGVLTLTFFPTNKEKPEKEYVVTVKLLGKDGDVKVRKVAKIMFNVPIIKTIQKKDIEEVISYPDLIEIRDTDDKWKLDEWSEDKISKFGGREIYVNLSSKYIKNKEKKQGNIKNKEQLINDYRIYVYLFTLFYHWEQTTKVKTDVQDLDEEEALNLSLTTAIVTYLSLWEPK